MDENDDGRAFDAIPNPSHEDALAKMQASFEHAVTEDCNKLPAVWVNNFRLSFTEGAVMIVFSDAQDATGRHIPRARGSFAMPIMMFEQLVEGVGPQYLERIREVNKQKAELQEKKVMDS
jgi:hypothetical protein